jgi:hypothetical protein
MTVYKNFTVDFPKRLSELDHQFRSIANSKEYEVTYLLMKLASSFMLPYERIRGTSGAKTFDISNPQSICKYLVLDKEFEKSAYCSNIDNWSFFEVDDFPAGPNAWHSTGVKPKVVWQVLLSIRHAVAHSNLFFGGEKKIDHIFLGKRVDRDPENKKFEVIRCGVSDLNKLMDSWITNVQKLRASPALIWSELEKAA